jgi:hypothetical protein
MIDKNGKEITNYDIQKEEWERCINKKEPCEDAVSRTNLLKKFEDRFIELQKAHQKEKQLGINWCINTLKDLPPVKPTRKKGKWIDTTEISINTRGQIGHEVICSKCNGISYFRSMGNKYIGANLCPSCGAEMET